RGAWGGGAGGPARGAGPGPPPMRFATSSSAARTSASAAAVVARSGDPAPYGRAAVGPMGNNAVRPAGAVIAYLRVERVSANLGSPHRPRLRHGSGTCQSEFLRLSNAHFPSCSTQGGSLPAEG